MADTMDCRWQGSRACILFFVPHVDTWEVHANVFCRISVPLCHDGQHGRTCACHVCSMTLQDGCAGLPCKTHHLCHCHSTHAWWQGICPAVRMPMGAHQGGHEKSLFRRTWRRCEERVQLLGALCDDTLMTTGVRILIVSLIQKHALKRGLPCTVDERDGPGQGPTDLFRVQILQVVRKVTEHVPKGRVTFETHSSSSEQGGRSGRKKSVIRPPPFLGGFSCHASQYRCFILQTCLDHSAGVLVWSSVGIAWPGTVPWSKHGGLVHATDRRIGSMALECASRTHILGVPWRMGTRFSFAPGRRMRGTLVVWTTRRMPRTVGSFAPAMLES